MIDTSSWDQSFVDSGDDPALRRDHGRCLRKASDSGTGSCRIATDPGEVPSWTSNPRRDPVFPRRRRTLNDVVSLHSELPDPFFDPPSSKSGAPDCAADFDVEAERSDDITDAGRMYKNAPVVHEASRTEEGARSPTGCTPTVTWLPLVITRASSSSSTSSAGDSVLELCTASSRCSSCSDGAAMLPALAGADGVDSGNCGSDAGSDCFRFPETPCESRALPRVSFQRKNSSDSGDSGRKNSTSDPRSYCMVANFLPEWDAERLDLVYSRLADCSFYYGRLSRDAAVEKLADCPVGTFLLRDSSDESHLFSVSVQTSRGVTSVRIAYRSGLFQFNSLPETEHATPTFDCVLRLVEHYVRICACRRTRYVLVENTGRRDTPILLRTPLRIRPERLAHLCRRTIHASLDSGPAGSGRDRSLVVDRLQLTPSLKDYLKRYPYAL